MPQINGYPSFQNNSIIEPAFQYNGVMTNINIDNALAGILDKFDSDYIMDTINYSIDNKFRPYDQPMPNIVYGYDQQFAQLSSQFSSNADDIAEKRVDTFRRIIDILCVRHNLVFNDSDEIDYYAAAFYLYKFLVSEFTNNIVNFFTNFLIKERIGIYNAFDMKEIKKNDSSLSYSRKLFKDDKLGIIHGSIGTIIANIQSFDIDLYSILDLVYVEKDIARYIFSIVSDRGNFFRDFYVTCLLDPKCGAELQTLIKLNLQTYASQLEFND